MHVESFGTFLVWRKTFRSSTSACSNDSVSGTRRPIQGESTAGNKRWSHFCHFCPFCWGPRHVPCCPALNTRGQWDVCALICCTSICIDSSLALVSQICEYVFEQPFTTVTKVIHHHLVYSCESACIGGDKVQISSTFTCQNCIEFLVGTVCKEAEGRRGPVNKFTNTFILALMIIT